MKICPACGADLDPGKGDEQRFCEHCGYDLGISHSPISSEVSINANGNAPLSPIPIKLDIHILGNMIFAITSKSNQSLAWAFLRIQEYNESPNDKFRGHYFSMKEYTDWWSSQCGEGKFTYIDTCKGFNISGSTIDMWETKFRESESPLREEEELLLHLIHAALKKGKKTMDINKIYVIGLSQESLESKDNFFIHELSHAFFHIDDKYRKRVSLLYANLPENERQLPQSSYGYCKYCDTVLMDEIIAYKIAAEVKDEAFMKEFKKVLPKYKISLDTEKLEVESHGQKEVQESAAPIKKGKTKLIEQQIERPNILTTSFGEQSDTAESEKVWLDLGKEFSNKKRFEKAFDELFDL